MMTEAGIIGKIGMNSAGVGVGLNALSANGVDFGRLPCHLALRTVLNSDTRQEAVRKLESIGVASACHIFVGDVTGGVGLECSAIDIQKLEMDDRGIVTHTNHFLASHGEVTDPKRSQNSLFRLGRIRELVNSATGEPSMGGIAQMLCDEEGYPDAINRGQTEDSTSATLFSVVMDLAAGYAKVRVGRPSEPEALVCLRP